MTLELIPNGDLVFKGPFTAVSTTTLKLSNTGNERLAYKIKTTAPKRYCVKPNSGFLDAHGTAGVQVMLQPQTAGQQDDRNKHKFMVQWAAVPNTYTDDVENFWKQDSSKFTVNDSKLKCVFADEAAPAVVPNDSEPTLSTSTSRPTESNNVAETRPQLVNTRTEQPSFSTASQRSAASTNNPVQTQQQNTGDDSAKTRLQQELDRLKDENTNLKEKLKQQELRQRNVAGVDRIDNPIVDRLKPAHQQQQQKGLVVFGVPLNEQIVLVAFLVALLFGFSLGYFLFSCGN